MGLYDKDKSSREQTQEVMILKINSFLLRKMIAERGWRQQQLADASGVSPSTISMICNGKVCRVSTALAIAKALGVELETLFDEEE